MKSADINHRGGLKVQIKYGKPYKAGAVKLPPFARGKAQTALHLMLLPAIVLTLLFDYFPMPGIVIAFKDYDIFKGIWASPWASSHGFEHFIDFFASESCGRVICNTVTLAILKLAFCTFPPLFLAVLLNELKSSAYRRVVQTASYLPHFISWSIAYGIFYNLFNPSSGAVNILLVRLNVISHNINFLGDNVHYYPMIISTAIWKGIGWGSILYLGSICAIDVSLFETLAIDGGNRWHKFRYIIWPHVRSILALLLILDCGEIMSGGGSFDQVYAFSNTMNRNISDILDTYVLRAGFENGRYSYATAVGFFQSVINFALLFTANRITARISGESMF